MIEGEMKPGYSDGSTLNITALSQFDGLAEIASQICETEYFVLGSRGKDFFGKGVDKLAIYFNPDEFWRSFGHEIDSDPLDLINLFKTADLKSAAYQQGFFLIFPIRGSGGNLLGILALFDNKEKQPDKLQIRTTEAICKQIGLLAESFGCQDLENFSELFELSEDLICISSIEGVLESVNPSFYRILGWTTDQLIGKSLFDFVFDKDKRGTRLKLKGLLSGVSGVSFTHKLITSNNDFKTIEWVATIVPTTGKVSAIGRDITEELEKQRKLSLSEKKFKIFFENSQGLMCTHDLKGKLISVNASGAKILGYTKSELEGNTLYDIVPSIRHTYLDDYLNSIALLGYGKGHMVTLAKDGFERIWMFSNVLQVDNEGEPYVIGNAVDITEQYELENDLRHTKGILEQTNKVARVGGWEVDLVANKIEWTPLTREIHEVDPDFIPQLDTAINFYKEGESRNRIETAIEAILENGNPYDLELEILTAKGREAWVRSIGNAVFTNGVCTKLFGTFQDIDEHKRVELEVGKSKKLLDDVLNAASDLCIIATDTKGVITVFNKGAENLLGYSASEMVGKQTAEVLFSCLDLERLWPEEYKKPKALGFERFMGISPKSSASNNEIRYITKAGHQLEVSLSVSLITDPEGEATGFLGVATDITHPKALEEALSLERARLLAFVEHTPAAVAMLDKEMRYLAVSRKWVEDYNLDHNHIIGASHYQMFPNLDEARKARHQEILKGKIERREEDIFIDSKTEEQHFITLEMRPWYRSEHEIGGMMIFTQDISGMIAHRDELRAAKIHTDEANLAKSEFLANMSHEIRTPLNGVIGFTDLVLKTGLDEIQQQYLTIVSQSAGALLNIINDILDFSKIEAGKFELDVEKCDLFEMTCQATDITTYQIQSKNLEMILNLSPRLPRFVWVDDVRLKQVLVNLLGNASKFTEQGEIELKVEVQQQREDKCLFRFSIRDTGIGIQPDKQEKIFEAFAQEDSSTTKKYGGTGLGLTISNKLLKMMGSRLELYSSPGKGSTFYFDILLPCEQGEPEEWKQIDSINNVLVVDDNDNNRNILSEMLTLKGIKADQAKTGFEALQFLSEGKKYDVVLMDYHMPFMDGLEAIKKIRQSFFESHDQLPILLLHSSADDNTLIHSSQALHIKQRLIKPIKMSQLYNALAKLHVIVPEKTEILNEDRDLIAQADIHSQHRIMIVEDNEVNLMLTRSLINNRFTNIEIIEAKNGKEALELFVLHKPELVLMDVQMPIMNGYQASKAIRATESEKRVPIIAVTAGNLSGEREKCLEAGMDDFLPKPILQGSLEAIMAKWITGTKAPNNKQSNQTQIHSEHFDPSRLALYYGENKEKLAKIVLLTISQLEESKAQFEKLMLLKDLENLRLLGHKVYGTSVSAGLTRLAQLATDLEVLAVNHSIEALFEKFSLEVSVLKSLLTERYLI